VSLTETTDPALLQYPHHVAAPGGNIARYRAECPRRAADGSGLMAHDREAGSAREYQHRSAAAEMS
jgi:hypothetical protein